MKCSLTQKLEYTQKIESNAINWHFFWSSWKYISNLYIWVRNHHYYVNLNYGIEVFACTQIEMLWAHVNVSCTYLCVTSYSSGCDNIQAGLKFVLFCSIHCHQKSVTHYQSKLLEGILCSSSISFSISGFSLDYVPFLCIYDVIDISSGLPPLSWLKRK